MIIITAKQLSFKPKTHSTDILKSISFQLKQGLITAFLGKSGSGKTTLLKCLANLYPITTGSLEFPDKHLSKPYIGYVAQNYELFPHMKVLKNCVHPQMKVLHKSKKEAEKQALHFLEEMDLLDFIHYYPDQLSGGQKQRVAIARALSMGSKILLLDEPTSALDPENRNKLITLLKKLKSHGVSIIFSSHDIIFTKEIMEKVFFMQDGKIIETFDIHAKNPLPTTSALYEFMHQSH